jgi:hypothetical protein
MTNSPIQRFTAYRRNLSKLDTHTLGVTRNADNEPQYEGVIWSDGTVTLKWLTPGKSVSVWQSLADCLAVHGHPEYGTDIEWHDGPAPKEWQDLTASLAAKTLKEVMGSYTNLDINNPITRDFLVEQVMAASLGALDPKEIEDEIKAFVNTSK